MNTLYTRHFSSILINVSKEENVESWVAEKGVMDVLKTLLKWEDAEVRENAIWCLDNLVSGDTANTVIRPLVT